MRGNANTNWTYRVGEFSFHYTYLVLAPLEVSMVLDRAGMLNANLRGV